MPLTPTLESRGRLSPLRGMLSNAALSHHGVGAMRFGAITPAFIMEARTDSAMPEFVVSDSVMSDLVMLKKAPFPRSARLLRHADFERVYKQGRRHFSASMTVFYCERQRAADISSGEQNPGATGTKRGAGTPAREAAPGLRVGFTVSRALGGAVDRNRMKRRLREAVRLSHPPTAIAADVVINPKKSLLTADFTAILNEVTRAFAVIEQKLSATQRPAKTRNES